MIGAAGDTSAGLAGRGADARAGASCIYNDYYS